MNNEPSNPLPTANPAVTQVVYSWPQWRGVAVFGVRPSSPVFCTAMAGSSAG
jgi:hypothetical protein